MSLGDDILAHNELFINNEEDLFNLLVVVLENGPAQGDKRKQMSTIFQQEMACSPHVTYNQKGFYLTAGDESRDILVEKDIRYPFWSQRLGEVLCDMDAEYEDGTI